MLPIRPSMTKRYRLRQELGNLLSVVRGRAPHITLRRAMEALARKVRLVDRTGCGLLEITTMVGCTVRCSYCPQALFDRSYDSRSSTGQRQMELDDFRRYIETVPSRLTVSFAGMCEPWINRQCTEMVLHAHEKGHPLMIFTTLKGMTVEDLERIRRIPFRTFKIHLPDDAGHTGIAVDRQYLELLESIVKRPPQNLDFTCHVSRPHPEVRRMVDWYGPPLHQRAGNLQLEPTRRKRLPFPIVCELSGRDLDRNVLLPDGSVILCSMDFGMKHLLGNLTEMPYAKLFESEEFLAIRRGLDEPQSDLLCRHCHHAVKATPGRLARRVATGNRL